VACFNLPSNIVSQITFPSITSSLSLFNAIAFSSFAWEYLKGIEQAELRPEQIKDDLRLYYIELLKSRGLEGIYEFLFTFIATLAERKKQL